MKLLIVLTAAACLIPLSSLSAEFLCRANVSYSWEKDKEMSKIIVFVESIETTGVDEAAAKAALVERVEKAKGRASEQCIKDHQNQSGCIASKFASLNATMQALPFSSRKLVEESISTDCKAQQGKCLEPVGSDPQCLEKVAAPEPGQGKEAGKEGGKEAKKKK